MSCDSTGWNLKQHQSKVKHCFLVCHTVNISSPKFSSNPVRLKALVVRRNCCLGSERKYPTISDVATLLGSAGCCCCSFSRSDSTGTLIYGCHEPGFFGSSGFGLLIGFVRVLFGLFELFSKTKKLKEQEHTFIIFTLTQVTASNIYHFCLDRNTT